MRLSQESKTILITGGTDGIGYETVKKLISLGNNVLVHGRSPSKLSRVEEELGVEVFRADLSELSEVRKLAQEIQDKYQSIDVLINNAGVFKIPETKASNGLDIRFVVNTISPFFLTRLLTPVLGPESRVLNLSSAAQASVEFDALFGERDLTDFEAYAQSKLGITMWSSYLAKDSSFEPVIISVNPGSLLGTKMVKEGFGTSGNDINIGVNILTELALADEHSNNSGKYFDNDAGHFAKPQADGDNEVKARELVQHMTTIIEKG